jgi:hypothetical protein
MQAKSRWSAHRCFLRLLLAILFALAAAAVASASGSLAMTAPASAAPYAVMEAPAAGAAPRFSAIASRAKAWVLARYRHDMEESMAASSAR